MTVMNLSERLSHIFNDASCLFISLTISLMIWQASHLGLVMGMRDTAVSRSRVTWVQVRCWDSVPLPTP